MLKAADAQAVLADLGRRGEFAGWRVLQASELAAPWADRRKILAAIEGNVRVEGVDLTLRVGLRARFPVEPARVFLADPTALGRAAHVEADGYVCYADDEELARDPVDPIGDLTTAVRLATKTLGDAISGRSRFDLLEEFEAYLERLPGAKTGVTSIVEPDGRLRELVAQKTDDGRDYVVVADSTRLIKAWSSERELEPFTQRVALYVPLESSIMATPPEPADLIDSAKIKVLVDAHLSPGNRQRLLELKRRVHQEELVVLGFPRPSGGSILVGVAFRGLRGGHPFLGGSTAVPPTPIVLDRCERAHVLPRGGAQLGFGERRALVIGCGAVGGHVALGLAFAGFGRITLVDRDELSHENTFRHVLGNSALDEPKVTGLRREIERKVPYVEVATLVDYAEVVIETRKLRLEQFDVIVVAVGAPTTALVMNELLWRSPAQAPAVFTWLEPMGIGGHALLTHSSAAPGCYRCLFEPEEDRDVFTNRADLVEAGQSFTRDHLGCGGRFAPFAALDARRTADLAVGLAIDVLTGRSTTPLLRSWKGDPTALRAAGYRTSNRFELPDQELREMELGPSRCTVCRP